MTRTFIRAPAGSQVAPTSAEVAAALRDALATDGCVDVLDELAGAPVLAFTVVTHSRGPALIAKAPNGCCLAVCADPRAAVRFAFAALDRATEQQHPARPSPGRARRPVQKELPRD